MVVIDGSGVAASECSSPPEEVVALASDHVRSHFKLPSSYELSMQRIRFANGKECYFQLEFWSKPVNLGFYKRVFATPNGTLIAGDIVDLGNRTAASQYQRANQLIETPLERGASGGAQASLIVFSDYQCPWCKKLQDILERDIIPRQIANITFRHFPLSYHEWAAQAAELAACAEQQGKRVFWKVHENLFRRQRELTYKNIVKETVQFLSSLTGVDLARFNGCVESHEFAGRIEEDIRVGLRNGVNSTPTIFLNGQKIDWAGDALQLLTLLNEERASSPW